MNSVLRVFASRRMFLILLLGFSSGIPLALTASTLQAWMASVGVNLKTIGAFSLVGLPYSLKFLWAPVMDRFIPPFLGRRRGWMIVSQLGLAALIAAMAFSNPITAPGVLAIIAVLVTFFSASQDIVIDAYRTEILEQHEYGAGAGVFIMGYRIAMLVSGAVALILSDHLSWRTVYLAMAATLVIGFVATVFGPEPGASQRAPRSITDAVVQPFLEFFRRTGSVEILLFIILYKLGDVAAGSMTTPFMIQIGFSRTDIGTVNKVLGLIATIAGTLAGGTLIIKIGIRKGLLFFGLCAACSNALFMLLAHVGHNLGVMTLAVGVENLCTGMGTAAFTAFLMSLCDQRFTATQYALLTSFMALSRVFVGPPAGYWAQTVGWQPYFLTCVLLAIPGLLLLVLRYHKWAFPGSSPSTLTRSSGPAMAAQPAK